MHTLRIRSVKAKVKWKGGNDNWIQNDSKTKQKTEQLEQQLQWEQQQVEQQQVEQQQVEQTHF